MNKETPKTISAWAAETFGPVGSHARVAARANEEIAELLISIATAAPRIDCVMEAADVAIVLCRVSDRAGGHLLDDVALAEPPNDEVSPLEDWYAVQANARMAKLLRAVTSDAGDDAIRKLAANVYVCLEAFAKTFGWRLWKAVEKKMAVNRTRLWQRDGTGHGYHIRATTEGQPS